MPSSFPLATAVAVITLAAPSVPDGQVMSVDGKGASDGDEIGYSIAIDGKYLISGTPNEDFNGTNSGYVNCYRQDGSQWNWVYEDIPTEGLEAGDQFGWSVDLSGKYAIVGAPGDDDQGTQSGAAYIFIRGSDNEWTVEDKITDTTGADDDNFGGAVAIDGKYAVVGSPLTDGSGPDVGRVSIFTRQRDGNWTPVEVGGTTQGLADDEHFGWSVALDGKTAAAGTPGVGTGLVYLYRLTSQGWTQEDVVQEGEVGDEFGTSVSISGKYLIVGAPKTIVNGVGAGRAYVFSRGGNGVWNLEDTLQGVSVAGGDNFGISVSISGTTAVVGASRDNTTNGVNSGSYYVFKRTSSGNWALVAGPVIAEDGLADAEFGAAVAIDKKNVAVGAPQHSNATGRSYVFR